jgi:hypothetical protein
MGKQNPSIDCLLLQISTITWCQKDTASETPEQDELTQIFSESREWNHRKFLYLI